jgi:peptidoglycan/xylan/chitin deacetylase (PgdA/CDA1 family)
MSVRLVKLFVSFCLWIVDYIGASFQRMIGIRERARCVVLLYHAVNKEQREMFARQMDDIIRWAKPISIDNIDNLSNTGHCVAVTFDDGFQSIIENVLPDLAKREIPVTIYIPTDYLGKRPGWLTDDDEDSRELVMTADQVSMLNGNLVFVGSHCVTHTNLLSLNKDEAEKEIIQSKDVLEMLLKKKIQTLSFPHGAYNETHVQLARQAGYTRVVSVCPTMAHNEYVIGRVRVDPTDWRIEFILKLLGNYRWLPLAINLKSAIKTRFNFHFKN